MITEEVVLKKKREKTPSERLRAVMFLYWRDMCETNEGFETFYDKHMNGLISQYKSRLKDN